MKHWLGGIAAALFLAAPAMGADLAVKAPVYKAPVMEPVYSWAGFYIGGNVGYSWGKADDAFVVTGGQFGTISQNMNGWLGGGQIGYNWQNGNWVFGLEGDIQGTGQRGTLNSVGTPVCPVNNILVLPCATSALSVEQKLPWFATVRGRLGVTPADRWLLYVTGGLAVGEVETNATLTDTIAFSGGPPISVVAVGESVSTTRTGWTIGGGVEWALGGQWTAKAEYLYIDLGTVNTAFIGTGIFTGVTTSSHITDNIFRVGVNYRFGGPVVARY